MHVFMTGASGFVGSAVAACLRKRGHSVAGLARSDNSAKALEHAGVEPVRGDLQALDVLASACRSADGVVHCGFIHDFTDFAKAVKVDEEAIVAMGEALGRTGRPLLVTSGFAGLPSEPPATENDAVAPGGYVGPARMSEETAARLRDGGIRAGTVRLAPSVHGDGDHGFVPQLIRTAREKGVSAYVGEGRNRWPAVHRQDAAMVYALALEKGGTDPRYHAAGEEGIAFRDIAEAIGRGLGLPTASIAKDEAGDRFGWIGQFVHMDMSVSAALTRERLGWAPIGPGLIADLDEGSYFD